MRHQIALNNTRLSDQSILVFNRVPKAGSEMVWSLINRLSHKNNFTSYSDSMEAKQQRGAENTYLTSRDRRKYYADLWAPGGPTEYGQPIQKGNVIVTLIYILTPQ